MDRLLKEGGPNLLKSFRDRVLPICDSLIGEFGDDVDIAYDYTIAVKENGKIIRIAPENGERGRLIHKVIKIGAGWQTETENYQVVRALWRLHGILQSLDRLPSTDHALLHAYRETLRWFRLAFEVPSIWSDGDKRAQAARRASPQRAERMAWIGERLARGIKVTPTDVKERYGIEKALAKADLAAVRRAAKTDNNHD
jgi:hypothetical protein